MKSCDVCIKTLSPDYYSVYDNGEAMTVCEDCYLEKNDIWWEKDENGKVNTTKVFSLPHHCDVCEESDFNEYGECEFYDVYCADDDILAVCEGCYLEHDDVWWKFDEHCGDIRTTIVYHIHKQAELQQRVMKLYSKLKKVASDWTDTWRKENTVANYRARIAVMMDDVKNHQKYFALK